MLVELFDRIIREAKPVLLSGKNGIQYCDKKLFPVSETDGGIQLNSIDGFLEFSNSFNGENTDYGIAVHIESATQISLLKTYIFGNVIKHVYLAKSECITKNLPFQFNTKIAVENFIIRMLSDFEPTPKRDALIKRVSSIRAVSEDISEDDGISQKIHVKRGIALNGEETLDPCVELRPYRTFHEIEQPESKYILRVFKSGEGIQLGLFEAYGNRWQYDAIRKLREYISERTKLKIFY